MRYRKDENDFWYECCNSTPSFESWCEYHPCGYLGPCMYRSGHFPRADIGKSGTFLFLINEEELA